jgi:hypothetical protein
MSEIERPVNPKYFVERFPQDATAASSVLGDTCTRCGGQLDFDEVDVGVGTIRGNPGCPECHWTPTPARLADECQRCGTPLEYSEGLERDYPDCPRCRGAK